MAVYAGIILRKPELETMKNRRKKTDAHNWTHPRRQQRGTFPEGAYQAYGLATVRYPVLQITARVEPFENGRGFSMRAPRAGRPRTQSLFGPTNGLGKTTQTVGKQRRGGNGRHPAPEDALD